MRTVVFHGPGDLRLEDVADPKLSDPFDAVVRITASAECGTDLRFRGTMCPMREGTVLGHEAVGIVEEVGPQVRNLTPGDHVVVPSTIACGWCAYCRAGYFAQCNNANPNGPQAGTAFYGGPEATGPFDGLQAEKARVPYANVGVHAEPPTAGPAAEEARQQRDQFDAELARVTVEDATTDDGPGRTGQAPSQAAQWVVQAVAAAGTIGIIGVYPPELMAYPIGMAMNRNLTVQMGNRNHRRYIPDLAEMTRSGAADPAAVLSHDEPLADVTDASQHFNDRDAGWIKVELVPVA